MYSSLLANAKIVELLLINGANPNILNGYGETALVSAENKYSQSGLLDYKRMVDLLKAN